MADESVDVSQDPYGGPWGSAMDVILCLLPLAFLVITTLSKRFRIPTVRSLPMAAGMMWFIRLAYLSSDPNQVNAAVITGALEAITPLTIIGGAILLFATMQHTMCLPWIVHEIKNKTKGHPVAEVFLIGWAFAYLIEGASGFGTPVALGAPMLVELGHPPLQSVVCLLIMNTLATPYGAVGTPIWFGFGDLGLSQDNLILTGFKTSVIDAVVAHIVPLLAATFLVSWADLRRSKLFVLVSIWSCVVPAVVLSYVSFEFSSILGGVLGVLITAIMAQYSWGLGQTTALRTQDSATVSLVPNPPLSHSGPQHRRITKTVSMKDPDRPKPKLERRASIQVATLAMEPHIQRSCSFESSPGDFYHEEWGRRVRNRLLFPITYDPLNFARLKITRGVQVDFGSFDEVDAVPRDGPQQCGTSKTSGVHTSDADLQLHAHHQSLDSEEATGILALNIEHGHPSKDNKMSKWKALIQPATRTLPLWGTVLLLIITRVPQFGVKDLLQKNDPHFKIDLGTLGDFRLSAALVVSLSGVLGEESVKWSYQALYVPFILPFVAISAITIIIFRRDLPLGVKWWTPFSETFSRVGSITVALVGALILVSLIRTGGNGSPAFIIGSVLADAFKDGFIVLSLPLGALGSFFSGSTTVSNLTFGTVQKVAALKMDRSVTSFLALQCVGSTLGNMICINNIISARAVLGLDQSEGEFIRRTGPIAGAFYVVGTLVGLIFVL